MLVSLRRALHHSWPVAVAAAAALTLASTTHADGSTAPTPEGSARIGATPAVSPHELASESIETVVRWYDGAGRQIAMRRYPQAPTDLAKLTARGLIDSGSDRVGPEAGGTARADLIYTGRSTLGFRLWTFDVWTKWSWDHTSCPCSMKMIDKGAIGTAIDSVWDFDKIVATDNHYVSGSGGPHTAYDHIVQGQFSGPSIVTRAGAPRRMLTVHRRPVLMLQSNNDGTDDWTKLCC